MDWVFAPPPSQYNMFEDRAVRSGQFRDSPLWENLQSSFLDFDPVFWNVQRLFLLENTLLVSRKSFDAAEFLTGELLAYTSGSPEFFRMTSELLEYVVRARFTFSPDEDFRKGAVPTDVNRLEEVLCVGEVVDDYLKGVVRSRTGGSFPYAVLGRDDELRMWPMLDRLMDRQRKQASQTKGL